MSSLLRKEIHSAFLYWGKDQNFGHKKNLHCRSRTNATQLINEKPIIKPTDQDQSPFDLSSREDQF